MCAVSAQSKRYITSTQCLMWYDISVPRILFRSFFFIKAFVWVVQTVILLSILRGWKDRKRKRERERERRGEKEPTAHDIDNDRMRRAGWRRGCLLFELNALLICHTHMHINMIETKMVDTRIILYLYDMLYTQQPSTKAPWNEANENAPIPWNAFSHGRSLKTIFVSTN